MIANRGIALKNLSYFLGVAITKRISAIALIFRPGKNSDKAALNTCSGWIRHRGRFYESRRYTFVLDVQLSKGDVAVFLLDKKKQPLLKLTSQIRSQGIDLDEKNRYYLRWEFKDATGRCELHW